MNKPACEFVEAEEHKPEFMTGRVLRNHLADALASNAAALELIATHLRNAADGDDLIFIRSIFDTVHHRAEAIQALSQLIRAEYCTGNLSL